MNVILGEHVQFTITGHSEINGASMPEGSTIVVTGNNPAVATPPATITPVGPGGETSRNIPVEVLDVGSVDWHVTVTDPEGNVYESTDTLIVSPVAEPGLNRVEGKFTPMT